MMTVTGKRNGILIPVEGEIMEKRAKGAAWSLDELHALVGGYVEPIKVGACLLLVDEDGRMRRLPVNKKASKLAGRIIVGPALLVRSLE